MGNLPTVPDIPTDASPALRDFLTKVKEILEVYKGDRGSEDSSVVTWGDLLDPNTLAQMGIVDSPDTVVTPFTDTSDIDPPTGMSITTGTWANTISWTNPDESNLSHIEVWVSHDGDITNGWLEAVVTPATGVRQSQYRHFIEYVTEDNYYWIRAVSWAGKKSLYCPSLASGIEFFVPKRKSLGQVIDGVFEALKGDYDDAVLYDAEVAYDTDDIVRWENTDGIIRQYKKTITSGSGVDPSNTDYWERVGILVTGEIDTVPTVGIDGNLVVDGSILARSIQTDQLQVGSGAGSNILMEDGYVKISHFAKAADGGIVHNDDPDSTHIDGGKIYAGSEVNLAEGGKIVVGNENVHIGSDGPGTGYIIVAPDGGTEENDYCRLDNGDITFNLWADGDHRVYNSLRRVEWGVAVLNNTTVHIPGYWKERPYVMVSPNNMMCYKGGNSGGDQNLFCSYINLQETGPGTRQYSFVPKAELHRSGFEGAQYPVLANRGQADVTKQTSTYILNPGGKSVTVYASARAYQAYEMPSTNSDYFFYVKASIGIHAFVDGALQSRSSGTLSMTENLSYFSATFTGTNVSAVYASYNFVEKWSQAVHGPPYPTWVYKVVLREGRNISVGDIFLDTVSVSGEPAVFDATGTVNWIAIGR